MNMMITSAAAVAAATKVSAATETDPAFKAIEDHRTAYAAMQAAFREHRHARELAEKAVGAREIEVASKVEPGTIVRASCDWDIERAVPKEKHPRLNARYNRLLEERRLAWDAFVLPLVGDEDEATAQACDPEFEALEQFAATTPTTLQGLLAMLIYAGEINESNVDAFDRDTPIFANLAAAAEALIKSARS